MFHGAFSLCSRDSKQWILRQGKIEIKKNRKRTKRLPGGSTALFIHNTTLYRFCLLYFIKKQIFVQTTADTQAPKMSAMQNEV